jgi:hypothetical protein
MGYDNIPYIKERIIMNNNQLELTEQYAKLKVLYKTVIYLQKEIVKEQDKLKQLKLEEEHRKDNYEHR